MSVMSVMSVICCKGILIVNTSQQVCCSSPLVPVDLLGGVTRWLPTYNIHNATHHYVVTSHLTPHSMAHHQSENHHDKFTSDFAHYSVFQVREINTKICDEKHFRKCVVA